MVANSLNTLKSEWHCDIPFSELGGREKSTFLQVKSGHKQCLEKHVKCVQLGNDVPGHRESMKREKPRNKKKLLYTVDQRIRI